MAHDTNWMIVSHWITIRSRMSYTITFRYVMVCGLLRDVIVLMELLFKDNNDRLIRTDAVEIQNCTKDRITDLAKQAHLLRDS